MTTVQLIHDNVTIAQFELSTNGLDAGQYHFSTIYICPECGSSWGRRRLLSQGAHRYTPESRHCSAHGGGNLLEDHDIDYMLLPDVRSTLDDRTVFTLAERLTRHD